MKITLVFSIIFTLTGFSSLQAQQFPADSPPATVSQRIGFSDIMVEYSRPLVNGRKIFGGLVPFGEVWRTGANKPSFITFPDTTLLGNQRKQILPGKYALYTIPGEKDWTIIFSKNLELWGNYGYNEKDDGLRILVPSEQSKNSIESFQIFFDSVTDDSAELILTWDVTTVKIPIKVNIESRMISFIEESIKKMEKPDGNLLFRSAKYYNKIGKDLPVALKWVNQSIEIRKNSNNLWVKAEILASMGNYKEAVQTGEEAISLAKGSDQKTFFPYEQKYRQKIDGWKNQ